LQSGYGRYDFIYWLYNKNEMKKDFVIEIIEFGKEDLLNNGKGITFEETLKYLKDKGFNLKEPAVIWRVLSGCLSSYW
jgi:hypothetical protein